MDDRSGKPIYVVDDSGSEDGDAAAASSVVDLTSDNTPAAASAPAIDDEVQFIGSSSRSSSWSSTAAPGAAAAASRRDQLDQYRAEMAASFVQLVGTKRGRPDAYGAAAAAGPIDRFDADRFDLASDDVGGGGFGRFGALGAHPAPGFRRHSSSSELDPDWLPVPEVERRVRHSTGSIGGGGGGRRRRRSSPSKSKKKKRAESPPPPLPMEKGKALLMPSGFDSLDMYYPHLKAADRTAVLYRLLPEGYTKKWTHDWRVAFEKKHPKPTLWSLASALSDEITGSANQSDDNNLDRKLPAGTKKGKGESETY